MLRSIFLSLLFIINLYANEVVNNINNQIFTLPTEAILAKEKIIDLIEKSDDEILIAMYNFSYKEFSKKLIEASKRGVKITVILDKEKILEDNKIAKKFEKHDIKVIIPRNKMHLKIAIFDKKKALIETANWTKDSFEENLEAILITDDKKVILKLYEFLNKF